MWNDRDLDSAGRRSGRRLRAACPMRVAGRVGGHRRGHRSRGASGRRCWSSAGNGIRHHGEVKRCVESLPFVEENLLEVQPAETIRGTSGALRKRWSLDGTE